MEKKFEDKLRWWQKIEAEAERTRAREVEREQNLAREQRRALSRELEYSTDEEAERHKTPAAMKRLEEKRLARVKEA